MMVLATNRPEHLDAAILDRIDDKVEFGLPALAERVELVNMYFKELISAPFGDRCGGDVDGAVLQPVAENLVDFSGREISKLMGLVQVHLMESTGQLSKEALLGIVGQKVAEHKRG